MVPAGAFPVRGTPELVSDTDVHSSVRAVDSRAHITLVTDACHAGPRCAGLALPGPSELLVVWSLLRQPGTQAIQKHR